LRVGDGRNLESRLLRGRDFYLGKRRNEEPGADGWKIRGAESGGSGRLYFMMLALERDMKVSRPFGVAGRYDVGVERIGGWCGCR